MRAPGEAPGLMALEIAIDELAEKAGIDPVEFRILNDTQVDPADPTRRFSRRQLIECLRTGADKFGWKQRNATPGQVRDGEWLVTTASRRAFAIICWKNRVRGFTSNKTAPLPWKRT